MKNWYKLNDSVWGLSCLINTHNIRCYQNKVNKEGLFIFKITVELLKFLFYWRDYEIKNFYICNIMSTLEHLTGFILVEDVETE